MSARLTPHQTEVLSRIRWLSSRGGPGRGRRRSFSGTRCPQRLFIATVAADVDTPITVGSAGALAHLAEKGYLRVVVDDPTCPIYVLREA